MTLPVDSRGPVLGKPVGHRRFVAPDAAPDVGERHAGGQHLFEIAPLGPGFAPDEDPAHLGETLILPPAFEHLRAQLAPILTPLPKEHAGVIIYDHGVPRPEVTPILPGGSNLIRISPSGASLYGLSLRDAGHFFRLRVDVAGVPVIGLPGNPRSALVVFRLIGAPVIRLVNQLSARAVETHASDVHIEPFEDRLRVRYRYDGVLHEVEPPPARLQAAVISRIKIMARLDIAERRLPQDGRIRLAVRGQDVDLRVSTIPSLHGETVVLRVLDRNAMIFEYSQLGLPANVVERFCYALSLPTGIVLVTGPTGSGKTTTLYTALGALNSVTRKIMTIEDPIEYQSNGITQIQAKPHMG